MLANNYEGKHRIYILWLFRIEYIDSYPAAGAGQNQEYFSFR